MNDDFQYNNAKYWQIALFSFNNAATNLYMAFMGYVSYYANSVAGFSVVLISFLLTGMHVFDGITDPIAGYILDKTKGRFGKFRPFMLLGNLLMGISVLLMCQMTHEISPSVRVIFFVIVYALFILGFTFQTVVSKAGQTVITNHPKQRPLATYFDSLFIMAAYGGTAVFVANYLIPKYGDFKSGDLFIEFSRWIVLISFMATLFAVIGIWQKDREKYFGPKNKKQKIRFWDYWDILKNNRPIGMLILAACINKFAATVYGHTAVLVMLFGIMMGDYAISGLIGVVTAIPTLLVVSLGIKVAQNLGQKKSFVLFTACGVIFQFIMMGILMQEEVGSITLNVKRMNLISILFIVIFVILNGCKSITNNMVVPMIADCSDYEIFRTGKYVPGLMGALFSFADKVFVALGTAFVGAVLAFVGYNQGLPQVTDELNNTIKWTTLFLYCILPIIGWVLSLAAMQSYSLDKRKMKEIQRKIHSL